MRGRRKAPNKNICKVYFKVMYKIFVIFFSQFFGLWYLHWMELFSENLFANICVFISERNNTTITSIEFLFLFFKSVNPYRYWVRRYNWPRWIWPPGCVKVTFINHFCSLFQIGKIGKLIQIKHCAIWEKCMENL